MELVLILILVILNGIFAMSEIAVVSARKIRLEQLADEGDDTAKSALELSQNPNRFLSTVQIGITLIAIVTGAVGGTTLASGLNETLQTIPALAPYSETLSVTLIILLTTYLSLVIGELVPKRLGMLNAERVAMIVARPMLLLSRITAPIVRVLSLSTDLLLRLMGVDPSKESSVSEAEIMALIEQGTEAGVFAMTEQQMLEGVLRLDDIRVGSLMTPRRDVVWLDLDDESVSLADIIREYGFSAYPVGRGDLDHVSGILRTKDLLNQALGGEPLDIKPVLVRPVYIPATATAAQFLELLKSAGIKKALVIDEHGGVDGLVSINDVIEEIVGDIEPKQAEIIEREDGSWLIDGMLPIHRMEELLPDVEFDPEEDEKVSFQTLAGFILFQMGRIPKAGEYVEWQDIRFEVVDMDENQIDKVLVQRIST